MLPSLQAQWPDPGFTTNVVGPWSAIFHGIEHAVGQSISTGPSNQVVHALRINLQDPDVSFFTSPRLTNAPAEWGETSGQTTSHFLQSFGLQVAVNANFFFPCCYQLEGDPIYIQGLAISRGEVVSTQDDWIFAACLLITSNNVPAMIATNWPPVDVTGIYTAVSGNAPLVMQGVNVGIDGPVHPRTAIGYTEDKRFLILMTIDGRQLGYSDGATEMETAEWMIRFGAYDALNLDGGGSTTMAMSDGRNGALLLNRPIHLGIPGLERVCANHFGVYARPAPPTIFTGNPTNHVSEALAIADAGHGFRRISVQGQQGRTYRLQCADRLDAWSWQVLTTGTADARGTFDYTDPGFATARFYRLMIP